jgi:flavin-dependent dehydrogenase
MKTLRPVTIVGGGLAGLSLGILLRREGAPVTLFEAGGYPRHRVCGEFVSGGGLAALDGMGALERLRRCGAREARTALFASSRVSSGARLLPEPALCLSRHRMDAELAALFCELGGELRARERWKEGFGGAGIVRATGRRLLAADGKSRMLGLKAHARGVVMGADLEVHLVPGGYVGLCQLGDGVVNVCGLFRRSAPAPELASRWREWLSGPEGSSLRARMSGARFEEDSFCAVAGLDLRQSAGGGMDECAIGDSLGMIAPVAGNGMSMAMESAEVAAQEIGKYSRGETEWMETRSAVGRRCEALFGGRLRWAARAHLGLLRGGIGDLMLWFIPRLPGLWKIAFERTR